MLDLNEFFQSHPQIPDWFKTHQIWQTVKTTDKIFPRIGLDNFEVECDLGNDQLAHTVVQLCEQLCNQVLYAAQHFASPTKQFKRHKLMASMLNNFANALRSKGLQLANDIVVGDKYVFAKRGDSIFSIYNKIVELCKEHGYVLHELDKLSQFKEYSSHNISGKLKVVFSSSGAGGAWDILTMSQRGITSCQAWNGHYKQCLIGSVLDPYTGIIYLTSGSKTEFGSKMMRRCLVRFVVDSATKKPALFLEMMYPATHGETQATFLKILKERTKLPVITSCHANYYVPSSKMTPILARHSKIGAINNPEKRNIDHVFTYRDTFVKFKFPTSIIDSRCETVFDSLLVELDDLLLSSDVNDTIIGYLRGLWHADQLDPLRKFCWQLIGYRSKHRANLLDLLVAKKRKQLHVFDFSSKSAQEVVDKELLPLLAKFAERHWKQTFQPTLN